MQLQRCSLLVLDSCSPRSSSSGLASSPYCKCPHPLVSPTASQSESSATCCIVTPSHQAHKQWHIPLGSFGTAMRTHAIFRHGIATLHSSTADTSPGKRVVVPSDMSRLATRRSALDPLQRSCGTKVRRVAACSWVFLSNQLCRDMTWLQSLSANQLQVDNGQRSVSGSLGCHDGPHSVR